MNENLVAVQFYCIFMLLIKLQLHKHENGLLLRECSHLMLPPKQCILSVYNVMYITLGTFSGLFFNTNKIKVSLNRGYIAGTHSSEVLYRFEGSGNTQS